MIAALAIFRFMVDDPVHNFHFTNGVIPLEVGGIVLRIPQAELDRRKYGQVCRLIALVGEGQFPDLQVFTERDEVTGASLDPGQFRADDGVPHSVTALVLIQRTAGRHPGRRPE